MRTGPSYVPADVNLGSRRILDEQEIARIRRLAPKGREAVLQLAREYEVSYRTIYRALSDPERCPTCHRWMPRPS